MTNIRHTLTYRLVRYRARARTALDLGLEDMYTHARVRGSSFGADKNLSDLTNFELDRRHARVTRVVKPRPSR